MNERVVTRTKSRLNEMLYATPPNWSQRIIEEVLGYESWV